MIAKKSGLASKITWILECVDMYKDWVYLFAFYHAPWAYHMLIISMVLPFAICDIGSNDASGNTIAHNLLNFVGFTES